jgi:diguanylate cyclase (GGDEF)-like protein/PAS domain S-box-containing protein
MTATPFLAGATLVAAATSLVLWRRLRALRRDVAELHLSAAIEPERALTTSAEWLALPVLGAQDAMWDWDVVEDRIRFSARWRELVGMKPIDVIASSDEWWGRVHPADRAQVQVDLAAQTAGTGVRFTSEHRVRHQSGQWLTLQWSGVIVRDAAGRALRVAGSVRDATAQRTVEEQARREAFYDTLTGLPNRALALDLLLRAIARTRRHGERRFAALLVNIDRFTLLNDSLGHGAGDEILRGVARRLATAVRPGDVLARIGGDVFLIILDAVSESSEAERIADRVHLVLTDPITVLSHDMVVSASVGIALHAPESDSPADYVRDAELALQAAKALGGGRHALYDPSMREGLRHRVSLEQDLRGAIARGEMMVWYQPVFSTLGATEQVVGFEALLRWNHPQRGLLGPGEFVPVAEETGMIVPLGTWAIGEACRHIRELSPNGADAPWVSVNIAARQLADGALLTIVDGALEQTGLPPSRLRLEVTENVILSDETAARETLQALRARGVRILMDDFGTGHASLSYLHRLPIATIKIDRYFVGRMDVSSECLEIVRSVIALAKSLSMEVVAEGVEQDAQLQALKSMGCGHVQGFLLSHPLRAEETHTLFGPLYAPSPAV